MKPREFWITNPDDGFNGVYNHKPDFDYKDMLHVIEYSALMDEAEAHKAMAAMYETERVRNVKLVKALEYNKQQWEAVSNGEHKNLTAWQITNKAIAEYKEQGE